MMLRVIRLSLITKGISLFQEKPNVFKKPFQLSNVLNPMGVTWDMVVKKGLFHLLLMCWDKSLQLGLYLLMHLVCLYYKHFPFLWPDRSLSACLPL